MSRLFAAALALSFPAAWAQTAPPAEGAPTVKPAVKKAAAKPKAAHKPLEPAVAGPCQLGVIAALAFLGFTTNPGAPDWGLMINENRIALTVQPLGVVLPVAAIALLTIDFNQFFPKSPS